jgi:hypothetical protein
VYTGPGIVERGAISHRQAESLESIERVAADVMPAFERPRARAANEQ